MKGNFVTRKISRAVAQIKLGYTRHLRLGNLNAQRDWGFAGDYVKAMQLMLEQDEPEDYVIATGESHSVREFVTLSFQEIGVEIEWKGSGTDEKGAVASFDRRKLSERMNNAKDVEYLKEGDVVIERSDDPVSVWPERAFVV